MTFPDKKWLPKMPYLSSEQTKRDTPSSSYFCVERCQDVKRPKLIDHGGQFSILELPEELLVKILSRVARISVTDWFTVKLRCSCKRIWDLADASHVCQFVTLNGIEVGKPKDDPNFSKFFSQFKEMGNCEIGNSEVVDLYFSERMIHCTGQGLDHLTSSVMKLMENGLVAKHGPSVFSSNIVTHSNEPTRQTEGCDGMRSMKDNYGRSEVRTIRERLSFEVRCLLYSEEKQSFMRPPAIQCEHTEKKIRALKKWTEEEYENALTCSDCLAEFDLRCILDDPMYPPAFWYTRCSKYPILACDICGC